MAYKEQKVGGFGIVQKNEDGTISQIGLTESQYLLFEHFLNALSTQDSPLKRLPKQFNLYHKNEE